jgi:hypothetical protein
MNHQEDDMHVIDTYIAAWNTTDPARRRALIDATWTEDARYVDPLAAAEGRDAIDATIVTAQQQFAGLTFRLAGPVETHHDLARFTWELAPSGEDAVVVGSDVVVLAEDGRIQTVHGFLDRVPGTPGEAGSPSTAP